MTLQGTASLASEIELWLSTRSQTEPEAPVVWCPRFGRAITVRNAEHLAVLLAVLPERGDWGVASRETHGWVQIMRVDGGWVAEVNGAGPDGYARRVRRAGSADMTKSQMRHLSEDGALVSAITMPGELIAATGTAARVAWAWLQGGLAAGFELRQLVHGVD